MDNGSKLYYSLKKEMDNGSKFHYSLIKKRVIRMIMHLKKWIIYNSGLCLNVLSVEAITFEEVCGRKPMMVKNIDCSFRKRNLEIYRKIPLVLNFLIFKTT